MFTFGDVLKMRDTMTTPIAGIAGDIPTWDDDEATPVRDALKTPAPASYRPTHDERVAGMAKLLRAARSAYAKVEGIDASETGDWTDYFADYVVSELERVGNGRR